MHFSRLSLPLLSVVVHKLFRPVCSFLRVKRFVNPHHQFGLVRMASTVEVDSTVTAPNFSLQQTMLRIKDPKVTIPFYEKNFGFKLIHTYKFDQWGFSLYFLAILPRDIAAKLPSPGTPESAAFIWSMPYTCLELTHNHGSESDPNFSVSNGNVEPYRGFGHIALMTPDVTASCLQLEEQGVLFQKKPLEGKMKHIAFALDPDRYWIEIIPRKIAPVTESQLPSSQSTATITTTNDANTNEWESYQYTFAQTMIRIKDPVKSLHFYCNVLGMTLLCEKHMSDFSLYFLVCTAQMDNPLQSKSHIESMDKLSTDRHDYMKKIFQPVLELTHNHGTEYDPNFKGYYNGNDQNDGQIRGFGHIGFLTDNLESSCQFLEEKGVVFKKKPTDGNMKDLAFIYDPDNYWVEIVQKNGMSSLN